MTLTDSERRLVLEVDVVPVAGSRFQPTGFPDLGESLFKKPMRVDGELVWSDSLLVESAQSMANRLEGVGWDAGLDRPADALDGLPWVRVLNADGDYVTSSRTEAHRLASAFIKDSALDGVNVKEVIRERLELTEDTPLSQRKIAGAVMAMDPLCLIHGVFFAESAKIWPGQPKITRAVTGFVEAHDVMVADSGGVKKDHVRHSLGEGGGTSEGYGTVPFSRREYTAARIVASFVVDRRQFRSYGLGAEAEDLLDAIALWEIRSLLDGNMRFRTACDLEPAAEIELPPREDLEARIRLGVDRCSGLLGTGGPVDVVWDGGTKKRGG